MGELRQGLSGASAGWRTVVAESSGTARRPWRGWEAQAGFYDDIAASLPLVYQ